MAVLEHTVAFSTAPQSLRFLHTSQWNRESLSAVVSLIQTTVAAPLALAVTEQENIRHVIGKNCSLCHQSICHSCQYSFGYQTLHFSAGCMDVPFLQWNTSEKASKFCRDPITLNKEKELIYTDAVHGAHCSGKQKAMSMM